VEKIRYPDPVDLSLFKKMEIPGMQSMGFLKRLSFVKNV